VLFLGARGEAADRITGLKLGGDDYLTKPFHLHEFLLRVKALLRRSQPTAAERVEFGGHVVDFRTWTARLRNGREVQLSEREVGILRALVGRAGEVVSRDEIIDRVWGDDTFPSSRTIDNFIVRLRRYFEPDTDVPVFIHTVWGVGYRFTPEPGPGALVGPLEEDEEEHVRASTLRRCAGATASARPCGSCARPGATCPSTGASASGTASGRWCARPSSRPRSRCSR